MKVLLDNGHGAETPGKRSPDGRLREYAYTREIAMRVMDKLHAAGIDVQRIVPEETNVPLAERVARANKAYAEAGKQATGIDPLQCHGQRGRMDDGKRMERICRWQRLAKKQTPLKM